MTIAQLFFSCLYGVFSAFVFGSLGMLFAWWVGFVRARFESQPSALHRRRSGGVVLAILGFGIGVLAGNTWSALSTIGILASWTILLILFVTATAGITFALTRMGADNVGMTIALLLISVFSAAMIRLEMLASWKLSDEQYTFSLQVLSWVLPLSVSFATLGLFVGVCWLAPRVISFYMKPKPLTPLGKFPIEGLMIETSRLRLIPATLALARAELADRAEFARLLGAAVPANWPPESAADALPLFLQWMETSPDSNGWFGWYAIRRGDGSDTLIGGAGFLGPPKDGQVETGYSVLPEYYRQGYATEMVRALMTWAQQDPRVTTIVAETEESNEASIGVLRKIGFALVGPGSEPGRVKFALAK